MDSEIQLLTQMGFQISHPDTGCCGMAGAFGFEQGEHYDVAIKCGERVLLPEVRKTDKDTILIADGFSCREQIHQTTGHQTLHIAQVLGSAHRAD